VYLRFKRVGVAPVERKNKVKEEEAEEKEGIDEEVMQRISDMLDHSFLLARYARDYTLRDRARFLKALVLGAPSTDLGALLLLAEKPVPKTSYMPNAGSYTDSEAAVGMASRILGSSVRGAQNVPPWTKVEVGKVERAGSTAVGSMVGKGTASSSAVSSLESAAPEKKGNGVASKTLDEWLNEEESVGEDEEDEGDEESEEESDESEGETESDESEEDEESNTEDEKQKLMKS